MRKRRRGSRESRVSCVASEKRDEGRWEPSRGQGVVIRWEMRRGICDAMRCDGYGVRAAADATPRRRGVPGRKCFGWQPAEEEKLADGQVDGKQVAGRWRDAVCAVALCADDEEVDEVEMLVLPHILRSSCRFLLLFSCARPRPLGPTTYEARLRQIWHVANRRTKFVIVVRAASISIKSHTCLSNISTNV